MPLSPQAPTSGPIHRFLPLRPGETPIVIAFILGMIGATARALVTGGYEFLFYIAVMLGIALAVALVHRRVGLRLATLWCLLAWGVAHMLGGMLPLPAPAGVLYNLWVIPGRLRFDQLVHAYGFGITAWVCWQALRRRLTDGGNARATAGMVVLAALAAMGLGALNEEIEFAATKLVEKTNVGDYDNNSWDLVFNMTGALIAAASIWITDRRRPIPANPVPRTRRPQE